ncbi:cytochrome P450 [Streptomyces sp. NPDC058307]|uniref:cytochrome P450 n=1 Tax=Streptomyces sp. NPDC058307 TaxID=3346439 RepID=UPI0036E86D7B
MTTATVHDATELFSSLLQPRNRPDPYPLWERLARYPVARTADGTYLVSGYHDITRLLRDPRVSSNRHIEQTPKGRTVARGADGKPAGRRLLTQDPPVHDKLRRQIMRHLMPRITGIRGHIDRLVARLLDAHATDGPGQLDVVEDLAYPLPVTVICELLGVPREDEPVFREFARRLTRGLDPAESLTEQQLDQLLGARLAMRDNMVDLVGKRKASPRDDLVSALLQGGGEDGPMAVPDLISNLAQLLVAGHETTVNLIANGALALLRHPDVLGRLRSDPRTVTLLVEEVLRYDPPVQMVGRSALADIEVGGTVIPRGSRMRLLLAAGDRDPRRFDDPGAFRPERAGNAHITFGGGLHYCVGAVLARTEAQVALTALARRLDGPRLVADPPPYRDNAILRGPDRLLVAFESLRR